LKATIEAQSAPTAGLEQPDMISLLPLIFRVGAHGVAALFSSGAAALVGLSPLE